MDVIERVGGVLTAIVLFVVIVVVYFTPWLVALRRRVPNTLGVFLLNLLLGWTVIGWVASLAWAAWPRREN